MYRMRRRTRKQRGGTALPPIYVVYFAHVNLHDEPWEGSRAQQLITHQLKEVKDWGLVEKSCKFFTVFTSPKQETLDAVKTAVKHLLPKAEVSTELGNPHERPGLLRVWNCAREIPEAKRQQSIILYFHSKGMVNGDKSKIKTDANNNMTNIVIKPWREIAARFKRDPAVNKAGFSAAPDGFIWHNFWWVRANYLMDVPRPAAAKRRHYFENWLALKATKPSNHNDTEDERGERIMHAKDCLSLCLKGADGELGLTIPGNLPSVSSCDLGM